MTNSEIKSEGMIDNSQIALRLMAPEPQTLEELLEGSPQERLQITQEDHERLFL